LEDVIEPMFTHQLWSEILCTESAELQPQSLYWHTNMNILH